MALTAAITRLSAVGTERWIVGVTRHVFSGMTSSFSVAGDAWRGIARWQWDFPDGQRKFGGVIAWCPTAVCVAQNVVLTVYDGLGNSATANYSVTVTAFSVGRDKYIDSGGDDTAGDGSQGNPWQSLNKAFDNWRNANSPPQGTLGRIQAPLGDTPPWSGAFPANPACGPLLVTAPLPGMHPHFQVTDNAEVGIASTGDATDTATPYPDPVIFDGCDIVYALPQNPDAGTHHGSVDCFHIASVFATGVLHNAKLNVQASGFVGSGITIERSADVGLGISNGANFCVVEGSTLQANGSDASFDHQLYLSGGTDHGFHFCKFDNNNAQAVFSGIKVDNASRVFIGHCTSLGGDSGIDSSGNIGNQNVDLIVDSHTNDHVGSTGFWSDFGNRLSFRNMQSYGGIANQHAREQSWNIGQFSQNVDVLGHSVNGLIGAFVEWKTSFWKTWKVRDNIVVKAGNGPFYIVQQLSDLANLDVDYNCYFRAAGSTDGQSNFAVGGGVAKTFTEWKALTFAAGADAHSFFSDPMFVGDSDLRLLQTSPCIGQGQVIQAIAFDAANVFRGLSNWDMGALQSSGGGVLALPVTAASRGRKYQTIHQARHEVVIDQRMNRVNPIYR